MIKSYEKPLVEALGSAASIVEGGGTSDPIDSDTVIDGTRTITFSADPS